MRSNEFIRKCLPCDDDDESPEWMSSIYQIPGGRFLATNGHIMGVDYNFTGYSIGSDNHEALVKKIDHGWVDSGSTISDQDGFFMPFTDHLECENICLISFVRFDCKVVLAAIQRQYLLIAREFLGVGCPISYQPGATLDEVGDFLVYNGPLKIEPRPCDFSCVPVQRCLLIMTIKLDDVESNAESLNRWQEFEEWSKSKKCKT